MKAPFASRLSLVLIAVMLAINSFGCANTKAAKQYNDARTKIVAVRAQVGLAQTFFKAYADALPNADVNKKSAEANAATVAKFVDYFDLYFNFADSFARPLFSTWPPSTQPATQPVGGG